MAAILYLPCFDYFQHRQRPQHLLWEMSKLGFHVIYCNATRRSPDFIPLSSTFTLCNNVNALDYDREYMMWLTHGPYADLLPEFRLSMTVSDFADASVDEFAAYAQFDEKKAGAADLIIAASETIYRSLAATYPRCHLVRNGVDPAHFKGAVARGGGGPAPAPLRQIGLNKPIIGFWGALSSWLDLPLLADIADLRPDYNFVLIGGCNMDVSLLPRRDNIHYLGPLDYEALPFYGFYFDAAMIPFQIKPVTLAADPIKVYEYLACGLPVVSTELPQLAGIADIKLSRSSSEFARNLDWAVRYGQERKSIQIRLAYAGLNTWESRARRLAEVMISIRNGEV